MAFVFAGLTTGALAQIPPAPVREGCTDALIGSGESYDLSGAGSGWGANVDWIGCAREHWAILAGASTYRLLDSRWSVGRAGAIYRSTAGHVATATATAGSGNSARGGFAYRKLADGVSFKAADRIFAKVEHEYFDVDRIRGNVIKLGAVFIVAAGVSLDLAAARSVGGNLPTRSISARGDWVVSTAARVFGGFSQGRLLPQAADIATGERAPDVVSRQAFAGAALKLPVGELIAAIDGTRTAGMRRATYTLGLQVPL